MYALLGPKVGEDMRSIIIKQVLLKSYHCTIFKTQYIEVNKYPHIFELLAMLEYVKCYVATFGRFCFLRVFIYFVQPSTIVEH